jgi:AcrR family transcriptional regulator
LRAALQLAQKLGYTRLTQRNVAQAAGCSPGLILNYFLTVQGLRDAVMRQAVANEQIDVVAQGIVNRNLYALQAPLALKRRAMSSAYNA